MNTYPFNWKKFHAWKKSLVYFPKHWFKCSNDDKFYFSRMDDINRWDAYAVLTPDNES